LRKLGARSGAPRDHDFAEIMTSQHRIRARNQGLDKVRRTTLRVAGGGLLLSGGIAALASATYGGTTHHGVIVRTRGIAASQAPQATSGSAAAPLTDPTLPPTTLAPTQSTSSSATRTPATTSAPVATTPTTAAPLQQPQYTPQTQAPYTPPVVVSGGT
jgi:hypothetical protein